MISIRVTRGCRCRFLGIGRIKRLVLFILDRENRTFSGTMVISLVDREKIRLIKREFFKVDQETDVIAFPYGNAEPDRVWGEMILCPSFILEQARNRGIRVDQEFLRVTIHGLLHLLGYDDRTPTGRSCMEERQESLLGCFLDLEARICLVEQASKARQQAYAPCSGFRVGAALETEEGIYTGCNIENTSLGLTVCAERVVVFKAVSDGTRIFKRIAVVSDDVALCYPCGSCRQVLHEICPDIEILCANPKGDFLVHTLPELMPFPFQRSDAFEKLGRETNELPH